MAAVSALLLALLLAPPGDEATLRALLADAVASGATTVTIPPGSYRLSLPEGAKEHLLLADAHDLTIDARGVEVVLTEPDVSGIYLRGCRNVRIVGLTLDCDPLPFTQGTVVGIDPEGGWYDIALEQGYSDDPAPFTNPRPLSIFDPKTREYKTGVADLFLGGIRPLGHRVWRVSPQPEVIGRHRLPTDTVQVGDLAALPWFGGPALTCRECEDITFEEVTVYAAGAMAFHEHGGEGGTALLGCRVQRRPGTTRLLSTNADGYHCNNMRRGPTVEGCLFEGMHDDGINIHGAYGRVIRVEDEQTLLAAPKYLERARPGDPIEFYRGADATPLGLATVQEAERLADDELRRLARALWPGGGYGLAYRLRVDALPALEAGDAYQGFGSIGRGFVIRDNIFRTHRYRALLLRSMDGLVENNRIHGCTNDAITLTADLYSEGSFSRNVVVRNNTIDHVGMVPWYTGAITVRVWGAKEPVISRPHRDIVIEGNTVTDSAGPALVIEHAMQVVARGNRFDDIGRRRVRPAPFPAVRVTDAEVLLQNNALERLGEGVLPFEVDPASTVRREGNRGIGE